MTKTYHKSPRVWTHVRIAKHYGLAPETIRSMARVKGWDITTIEGLRKILNYYHSKYEK